MVNVALRVFRNMYIVRGRSVEGRLSLRAGDREFSPATISVVPGYFYWKIKEK